MNRRAISVAGTLLLAFVLAAPAQVQVGNFNMNLDGTVQVGNNGSFSNFGPSEHDLTGGGTADLNGYYYSPGFLSYEVRPFYNQSRDNSSFQSVFQTSGVNANAGIFNGSHFPGWIAYSKNYNSEGQFGVPGLGNTTTPELGNITTHGDNDNLGIGWGINVPGYPNVSLSFQDGNNTYSVFGANTEGTSHFVTLGATASYNWAGFMLNGGYHYITQHAVTPEFLIGQPSATSDSTDNSFNFGVGHSLPLNGGFSAGVTRSTVSSGYGDGSYNTTIDTYNAGASFRPVRNLNVGVNTQYTDNLGGTLSQSIISAGGVVPAGFLQEYSTHSLDVNIYASYLLPSLHLTLGTYDDHREQTVLGTSITSDTFNETASYGHDLLGGFFNATLGFTQTSVDTPNSPSSVGYFGTINYSRRVREWEMNGSFNYSRNTQTLLIAYANSGYGYSAGIGRRIGRFSHWSASATASKSSFNNVSGTDSHTHSYTTAFSMKNFSFSGGYSKADGTSILTPTGLVSSPVPTPLLTPGQEVLFGGKSYSVGAAVTPIHGLTLSASYSEAWSDTTAGSGSSNATGTPAGSNNSTVQMNTTLQYKLRQLWITGGYLRLKQGFSITGAPSTSDSSFYIGVSRWFKFF